MKTFYQTLASTLLANVTNMAVWFAMIFFIYLETKSVTATSIVSGIYLVAAAVSGIWFGSLVDHNKKKNVMIVSGLVSFVIYVLGFIMYLSTPAETWKNATSLTLWTFVPLLLLGVIAGNLRSIALVFTVTGIIGLIVTLIAMNTKYYRLLSKRYMEEGESAVLPEGEFA